MKQFILFLFVSLFCLNSFSQEIKREHIYPQVLDYYFNPLKTTDQGINKIYQGGKVLIDTVIVQTENYLPAGLPGFFNNHVVLYLSRSEINDYKGKHSILVLSPIKKKDGLFLVRVTTFSKRHNLWSSWGYREYKFAYNSKTQKFDLIPPVITFTRT